MAHEAHESGVIELEFCNGDRCPTEAFMLCDKEDEALLRRCIWIWDRGYARNSTGRQFWTALTILGWYAKEERT